VNPWVKVINDTAIAVNQLGARAGAISVTLDMWHRDIYDFLDLQTETGDIRGKAFDIFPAVSIPDLFMKRVEEN
jgi:ribonucleoside-diphosphate reductase alpha chain